MTPLKAFAERAEPLADGEPRDLIRQADHLYKLLSRIADATKKNGRGSPLKALDEARKDAVNHLKSPRYFWQTGAMAARNAFRMPNSAMSKDW